MSLYFKILSFYSFNKIKSKVRVATLLVFRLSFLALFNSIGKSLGLNTTLLVPTKHRSFVISKQTLPITLIKAPMAHKKWSKEQINVKYFLYSSSLVTPNAFVVDSSVLTYLVKLLLLTNLIPENPTVTLKSLLFVINSKRKLNI